MQTILLETLFNGIIPDALFRVLIHSLWLGIIMAGLAGLTLLLTKNTGPQLRYKILVGIMTAFLLSAVWIFISVYQSLSGNQILEINTTDQSLNNFFSSVQTGTAEINLLQSLKSFITDHSSWLMLFWLIVICFRTIQLILGFKMLGRLKKDNNYSAGEYWNQKLERLIVAIGVNKSIRLYQSVSATVPMVIGFLKPVILFPAAMLNALKPDEVEAILLHELAHIRRHDFLVNLLQRFTEIIFFFNPAVHWVSELIRREREFCCDDLAISVINDKKQYIYALVAFQEFQLSQPELRYANAFPGYKNQILHRVSRIINNNNKSLNTMEKIILGSVIIVMAGATLAFSQQKKQEPANLSFSKQAITPDTGKPVQQTNRDTVIFEVPVITEVPMIEERAIGDTSPVRIKHTMLAEFTVKYEGKEYEIVKKEDKVIALKINGREIPASEIPKHQDEINGINKLIEKSYLDMEHRVRELAEIEHSKLLEDKIRFDDHSLLFKALQQEQLQKDLLLNKQHYDLSLDLKEEIAALNNEALAKLKFDQMHNQKDFLLEELKNKSEVEMLIERNKQEVEILNRAQIELALQQKSFEFEKLQPFELDRKDDATGLMDELFDAGAIKDRNNMKMKLNNKELIINGKKQSEELHKRILKRYQKNAGDKVDFEYNISN